ncbi:MAG: amidohydrolase family protein [Luteolibacter sp.]
MKIDSHQHFWNYTAHAEDYVWMSEEYGALRRDFLPGDLAPILTEMGFDGTVAVQAREMLAETDFLLDLAGRTPWMLGVVGWIDLCAADAEPLIERYAAHPMLKGLRLLIHDRPDPEFAVSPEHLRGIGWLERNGLTYDLLLKPPHLRPATRLVDQFPDQKFVVDHLAKPDISRSGFSPWAEDLHELARRPHVFCKVSGMVTEADWATWTPAKLAPYLDVALEAFGPARLMIGSDWPVCTCAASYQRTMQATIDWTASLSTSEQAAILGGNCARFYDLEPPVRRYGMVIGLRDECEAEYRSLHEGPGVRDLLHDANIRNFNIFLQRLPDGKLYEFGYYEYRGEDYAGDMARLHAHPRHVEWLKLCDPMQLPLPGEDSWKPMDPVYFNA